MKKCKLFICILLLITITAVFVYGCNNSANSEQNNSADDYVNIVFEANGGAVESREIQIENNNKLDSVVPQKEGYKFKGWYTSEEYEGIPFDFNEKISSNTTLYAKWMPLSSEDITFSYGKYPQKAETDEDTIIALDNKTEPDEGEYYTHNSKTYKKVVIEDRGKAAINGYDISEVYYFEVMPIEWSVIDTVGNKYILMSDIILDNFYYHSENEQVTYETSDIRDFLINEFSQTAFNSLELGDMVTTSVINNDNSKYSTDGGDDTNDKVYLLSIDEAKNGALFESDSERTAEGTDYAKARGLFVNANSNFKGLSRWWLRSPGDYINDPEHQIYFNNAASIDSSGYLTYIGEDITDVELGIRPVICLPTSMVD